ncbi:MAG: hypothetical protein C0615_06465 [Desulfuromonas sp.]|nr:MAG: hypothetical protein C0615_06465 [Desulfuromonas sp.]
MPKGTARKPFPGLAQTRADYERQLPLFKERLHHLVQEIRRQLETAGFTPAIKYRVKQFDAYFDKLRKNDNQAKGSRSRPIGDFFALRIICPFLEDIDTIERLLTTSFQVVETERKSSHHSFREFGYDSLHLMIKPPQRLYRSALPGVRNLCEVQLRTILQDAWAEVEHELVYKSDINLPKGSIRRKLASLNATLTLSDLIFQEIRDYQKELRQHGRKRRQSIADRSPELELINISAPLDNGPKPIASTLKSRLEKTMLRALEAHSNDDLETAIELYGVILGMKLENKMRALIYNHRGMAHFACSNFRQAMHDFNRSIHFDPASVRSYANRGLCHRVMKRFKKALADFETAIEIEPGRTDHYFGRAQTYFDMQQFEQAQIDCNRILELSPGDPSAKELLANIKTRLAKI